MIKIELNIIRDLKISEETLKPFKSVFGQREMMFMVFKTRYKKKVFFCAFCGGEFQDDGLSLTGTGNAAFEGLANLNMGSNAFCLRELKGITSEQVFDKLIQTFDQMDNYCSIAFIGDFSGTLDEPISNIIQYGKVLYQKDVKRRSGLPLSLRFDIFKRDNYRCQICGRSAKDDIVLEVDHIVPKIRAGEDTLENLHTLCFDCNRGKRAELL